MNTALDEVRLLASGEHPDRAHETALDDELRSALAFTAATGETCSLPRSVAAVRAARGHLIAGELEPAAQALATAREQLDTAVPAQRDAR